jgi:2-aminoethylphosphonate-pyruvate transaminase
MIGNKLLFTPGPLTTSETVKSAMLRDAGSRDREFIALVRNIRDKLIALGGAAKGEYECVLVQGSGTFAIESVISSAIPREGRLLVLVNGAYGRRIAQMACIHGIETQTMEIAEDVKFSATAVEERLSRRPGVTHVALVHCETTTGILNPLDEIGTVVARAGCVFIVDAMSSFGAVAIDMERGHVDFLISSANKCIEGVPGFGFILARNRQLMACKGRARTLSLDLYAQWAGLESDGQFRFTPPTHVLLAFHQALLELEAEGGVSGRAGRYRRNHETLVQGMAELGFEAYLAAEDQSDIITTFRYPTAKNFCFDDFYAKLSDLGFLIYPGKLSQEPCFRIGTIGRLCPDDIRGLVKAIGSLNV